MLDTLNEVIHINKFILDYNMIFIAYFSLTP
jgi:hypothetical protein